MPTLVGSTTYGDRPTESWCKTLIDEILFNASRLDDDAESIEDSEAVFWD